MLHRRDFMLEFRGNIMANYYWFLFLLFISKPMVSQCLDVRLSGGLNTYEGRVEVYHAGQWGTVCDDKWTHVNCMVVCSQLNYGGGTMLHDADAFGTCTGPIHLDDVECDGGEHDLGECRMQNFGVNNCDHKEDVACKCDPNPDPPGTCLPASHRIKPTNPFTPWIGRVEVNDGRGWGAVCDDDWDDIDAHVFCNCLGIYNDSTYYRSYWSPELAIQAPISISFDSVKCNQVDKLNKKNIWECESTLAAGKCKTSSEAAGVACGPIPHTAKPEAPTVDITCDNGVLTACFLSSQYNMSADYLSITPECQQAVARNVTDGVCYDINMQKCSAAEVVSDTSHKHFCYDVSYSQFDSNADTLLIDNVWTRRTCCSQGKNGTALSSFRPLLIPVEAPVYSESSVNFTMQCFTDESFTGVAINASTQLTRGQDVYCRMGTDVWDDSLYLIVPTCHFYGSASGSPTFPFLINKCPTTEVLGLTYYSFERHSWGFKFATPKFQDHNELYVSCNAYVCDPALDSKPYCDRSCQAPSSRKKRSLRDYNVQQNSGANTVQRIVKGPFHIDDKGFGPLFYSDTRVMNVEVPTSSVGIPTERFHEEPKKKDVSTTNIEVHHFKPAVVNAGHVNSLNGGGTSVVATTHNILLGFLTFRIFLTVCKYL